MSEKSSEVSRHNHVHEPSYSPKLRFTVSVTILVSMGILALLTQRLVSAEIGVAHFLGTLTTLFLGFFAYEWVWVHSNALTRQKRAHFDEANILETYQPRARTRGHLFHPDPPTPGPMPIKEGDNSDMSDAEKVAFNANRDAHYKNMFEYAMRVAKEQEALEKSSEKKTSL